jgi:hypothetical protein
VSKVYIKGKRNWGMEYRLLSQEQVFYFWPIPRIRPQTGNLAGREPRTFGQDRKKKALALPLFTSKNLQGENHPPRYEEGRGGLFHFFPIKIIPNK